MTVSRMTALSPPHLVHAVPNVWIHFQLIFTLHLANHEILVQSIGASKQQQLGGPTSEELI